MPMGSAFLWSSLTLSHYLAKKLRLPLISSGKLGKPNEFHRFYWRCGWCCTAGVPHLWDLVPDDLMWSWCSNRRKKVPSKWSALESSWNHPPTLHLWKIVFRETDPWCQQGWGQLLSRIDLWLRSKESACNAGDVDSIPGLGRSPGEGKGNPLQYSCLRNPMDRGAWWATVHGVTRVGHDLATKPPPHC